MVDCYPVKCNAVMQRSELNFRCFSHAVAECIIQVLDYRLNQELATFFPTFAARVLAPDMTGIRSETSEKVELQLLAPPCTDDDCFVQESQVLVNLLLAAVDVEQGFFWFWTRQDRLLGDLQRSFANVNQMGSCSRIEIGLTNSDDSCWSRSIEEDLLRLMNSRTLPWL